MKKKKAFSFISAFFFVAGLAAGYLLLQGFGVI